MKHYTLHLANPAFRWDNASPVGCGSAGLMIWGGVAEERLTFKSDNSDMKNPKKENRI